MPAPHDARPDDDDACRLSEIRFEPGTRHTVEADAGGRFVQVLSGGVWIGSARRAHCVIRGGGVWLPPSVAHRLYAPYGAALRELRVAPASSAAHVHSRRIARCSDVLTSLLSDSGRGALARSPAAFAALLLDELDAAARDGAWELAIDMPSPVSRIAPLCDAMILDPGRDTRLDAVAARAGISERTLHRLFVDELGISTGRWRQTVQAGGAMCALALGMPVAAAARALGFTPSAFSTFFKARVGRAPHHWLAQRAARDGARTE
ncbi:helix-turn-helix domain-containing protein [Burkholderia sp. MR1-5-21]